MLTRIFGAGHRGMVGSALVRRLGSRAGVELVTRTHAELDLMCQADVEAFFCTEAIDQVYLASAMVGVIHANNTSPAQFLYDNLAIHCHVFPSQPPAVFPTMFLFGVSLPCPFFTFSFIS